MSNRGFPETRSSGTFFIIFLHKKKKWLAPLPEQRLNERMREIRYEQISNRRNTMKSGTQDQVEGTFHKVMGKLKEVAGKIGMNSGLEVEGKDEKIAGKVQEKIGQVKKVLGK